MTTPLVPLGGYPVHPAAAVFPLLEGDEFGVLVGSIKDFGLLEPVTLHEGAILDGRNRLRACIAAGVTPRFVNWDGECGSPIAFAAEKNIHRRHLTPSQRAATAVQFLDMLEDEARERLAEAGRRAGRGRPVEKGTATGPEAIGGEAREKAAAITGSSARSVSRAKAIKKQDEAVFDQVKAGVIDLAEGARRVELANKINDLPADERHRSRDFLEGVIADGNHSRIAIELAGNLATMPTEDRLRIYGLHESGDPVQQSLAKTEAAKLPPMPNPALALLREARRLISKAETTLMGEPAEQCRRARSFISSIVSEIKEAA